MVLGLLFAFAVVQVAADTDETYGSTDAITFKFGDEATAAVPSDDDPTAESFSAEPAPAADEPAETLGDDPSFADESTSTETLPEGDNAEPVVFTTDADGANSTSVGDDGFDMVEGTDQASLAE